MAERAHAAPQRTHAREYELVYILKSTVGPSEAKKVADRISDVAEKQGAKLIKVDNWGRRKLAYQIDRNKRGIFVLVRLVGFGDVIREIERNLRILDPVLRFQTIRTDVMHDFAALTIDPEEVEFREVEPSDDENEDPTFEEQLGMRSRPREPKPAPPAEGDTPAEGAAADGEAKPAADGEAADGEAKAADAADAAPAADAATESAEEKTETAAEGSSEEGK